MRIGSRIKTWWQKESTKYAAAGTLLLALAGTALALIGLAGAILWAVQTSSWYTDWGRFGTALYFEWPGPVLLGGLLLLLIALALLAADVLLSKRDLPHF